MAALLDELNLMGYRAALAAFGAIVLLVAPPRCSRITKLRASGWSCLLYGIALAVGFCSWDRAYGRWAPFEYMPPIVVALLGIAALEETGGLRFRRALVEWRRLRWRHVSQLLLTGLRAFGWVLFVPAFAAALPWWLGLPPYTRDFGRFALAYALASLCLVAADVGHALIRRPVDCREAVNRPIGALLLDFALFACASLLFVVVQPDDPWTEQVGTAGMLAGLALLVWYLACRWTRVRMALPPLEIPTVAWVWRRIMTGVARRRFRPAFRLREEGPYIVVEGDLSGVPSDHVRVEVLPRRITVTVVEPLDGYSPWGGWSGVAPLPRTVEPAAAEASITRGRLRVRVPRRYGVDLSADDTAQPDERPRSPQRR